MEFSLIQMIAANILLFLHLFSREVTLELKDGRRLITVEPQIDEIIDLAIEAEGVCGKILMGTE